MLVPFTTEAPVSTREVGGKAASLIRLRQNGFSVPDGFVLTTEFFGPWLDVVKHTNEWREVAAVMNRIGRSQPDRETRTALNAACDRVKALAGQLEVAPNQREALMALDHLAGPYAVRSSSPEEDLGGASFAGQYESLLGVQADAIDDAIRHCFASCLDARVLLYKKAMEFDGLAPSIAVAVQQMVAADIAGVAFSINPLSNDFDEVLINASWGVGEALVSGDITPDSVVVNKINGEIIEHRAGDKGGDRSAETCLDDGQIAQLKDAVIRIEALYGDPVDVEFAFADGHLHVLQARPITSYVPLAERLQTKPGEPRHLYFDGYLTDGITMSSGTSPMADDMFHVVMSAMIEWMVVPPERQHLDDFGMHMQGIGRFYIDLSLFLNFVKPEVMRLKADTMNPAMAAMLTSPELLAYKLPELPDHLRPWKLYLHAIPVMWRIRRALTVVIKVLFKGADFLPEANAAIAKLNDHMARPINHDRPLQETLKEELVSAGQTIIESSYPGFMLFFLNTTTRLPKLIDPSDPEQVALADDLQGGYVDDMVVKMGHRMYDMSRLLTSVQIQDLDALVAQVRDRTLSDEFMRAWDEFIAEHGHRGPLEMDVLHPRYGDDPRLILQQVASVAKAGGDFNPHTVQATKVQARERAFARLSEILPPRKARKLTKIYQTALNFSGMREMFKHHLTQLYHRTRKQLVHRAEAFVGAGRLDRVEQIFELTIADVDRAFTDPTVDLRALVEERGRMYRKLKAHVRHFPQAIDSRGRILRAKIDHGDLPEGTLAGVAVSPGVATGPIKVLNDPFEKEVEPGDILVAVTTDPGWTPLFINAAAVILEIGGELQHGALVAREYGKPCVSGIDDVTSAFSDGQMVEVDGDTGLVRFLEQPSDLVPAE